MSFFASGMGAWVVYGTTEMGATPRLSWLGVIGYSAASAFPALFIMWLGPMVREASGEEAFCTTDFARKRYGRVMQLSCAAISIFYMFVYLVAELTSISNIYALMINKPTLGENWDNINEGYTTGIAVSIGVITIFYTGIAGKCCTPLPRTMQRKCKLDIHLKRIVHSFSFLFEIYRSPLKYHY